MSIYIGQTTNAYGFPKSLSDRLVINPPINQDELNVIKIGSDIQLGSRNNRFLVFDRDNEKILDIGKTSIVIDQPTTFNGSTTLNGDVHIHGNHFSPDNVTIDTHILNINNAVSVDSSGVISFPANTTVVSNTPNTIFNAGIKVNEIFPLAEGSNVVIKNLILDDVEVEDAIFKNNILIDHSKLPDKTLKNDVVSFKINKNKDNTEDFIQLLDNSKTVFKIAKNGSVSIFGDQNPTHSTQTTHASLTLGSMGADTNLLESFDSSGCNVATINNIGHLVIGKENTDSITSVLSLHRRDTFEQNDILRDPVCMLSMDYDPEMNKITENHSNLSVGILDFYPFLDKDVSIVSTDGYVITLHWLPFRADGIEYPIREIPQFSDGIDIGVQSRYIVKQTHYDHGMDLTTNSILVEDTASNIRIFTEFHNNPLYNDGGLSDIKQNIEDIEEGIITPPSLTDRDYIKYTCNIYLNRTPDGNTDNPVDDITLTFELYWIYKRDIAPNTFNIAYVDTNPVLVEAPPFIDCVLNGVQQASVSANGKVRAKTVDVSETLSVTNLDLKNVVSTSFNVDGIKGNTLHIYDKIDVGNGTVTISADQGIQLSQGIDIKNTFSSISFCNVDASHFKYSTTGTEILNPLYVGECALRGSTNDLQYTLSVNGDIGFISSTESNLISFVDTGISIEKDTLSYDVSKDISLGIAEGSLDTKSLAIVSDNNTYVRFMNIPDADGIKHQQISFANDSFVNMSVGELKGDNKMSIGIPYTLIATLNNQNEPEDWYRMFREYTNNGRIVEQTALLELIRGELKKNKDIDDTVFTNYKNDWENTINSHYNHILNTYGNVRFADDANNTLVEIREKGDHENRHKLPTLNVFGNIRCRSFDNDTPVYKGTSNDALEIVGTSLFHDKVFTIKGVSSLSDRRVKDDLQQIKDPLEKIKSLVGYTYNRTDISSTTREAGLIAQDVEEVMPEVITDGGNGMKHIAYGNMMGLIVEAIKNIDERLEKLERSSSPSVCNPYHFTNE